MENEKKFFRIPEAMLYLGLRRTSIYNLISKGKLPKYKIGSATVFKREDLEALAQQEMA